MRIVVCVRQGTDGEPGPFDACAYEEALRIRGAEVILLSMGPLPVRNMLLRLTRLGAKRAVLLSDPVFAGSDTLATARALSLAMKKLEPDLVFCGRQALIGDTGQVGPMLAALAGYSLITDVMGIRCAGETVVCKTREEGERSAPLPALLTIERISRLRLPSILSGAGNTEVWTAQDIGADPEACGLAGSPTRVLETYENQAGKRKCAYIGFADLPRVIAEGMGKDNSLGQAMPSPGARLERVCVFGEAPLPFAETVSDDITVFHLGSAEETAERIRAFRPKAVLFGSDPVSRRAAAGAAALLSLGLCADCTRLETDGETLTMIRPALSGSVTACIRSRTVPAMATVRTVRKGSDLVVAAGYGAKDAVDAVKRFAESLGAELAASRKAVDNDLLPYDLQVGLTGKTVSPRVYIAVGISGAVQHIAGMERSGTVIAVNPDPKAPIFEYADYGIVGRIEDWDNPKQEETT